MAKLMGMSDSTSPEDSFSVDDVITHAKWPDVIKRTSVLTTKAPVPANGGSVYLRLTYRK